MPVIFSDPVGWSGAAVATKTRFCFMVGMMAILPFVLVYVAISGGWSAAWGLALFLGFYQFMFLFALRQLYLRMGSRDVAKSLV